MIVYKQGIVLNKLKHIQERYKNVFTDVEPGNTLVLEYKKGTAEIDWITENVLPDVEKYSGREHQIHKAVLFAQGPRSYPDEHVDGFWPPKSNAVVWSLNIPIMNCDQGEMRWYSGDFELSSVETAPDYDNGYIPETPTNQKSLNSIKIKWSSEKKIIDKLIINQPTVVKVNLPHQVINTSHNMRVLLAVRFSPDLII